MNLQSIYISNGTGIFMLLMLLYVSGAKIRRHRLEDRIYVFLIFGVMLGCFMEAFSYTIDGKLFPYAIALNHVANTYLFSINLLLPFSVLVYVELDLYDDISRIKKLYNIQIIILLIMLMLNVVNLFVPIVYSIDANNVYSRLPLGNVYYIIIVYYFITALIVTKRYEKEYGAKTFLNIYMFLIPVIIGAGLQFMFYGLSLAWLAAAAGLTGLYMMQQNETAYIDSLVEIYNRQYLNHIIANFVSSGKCFVGVMLDIDRFKTINDNYGHSEGDNALIVLANILKKARKNNELAFRFAGDEFIVLKMGDNGADLESYMDEVEKNIEEFNMTNKLPYKLKISYGFGLFDPDKDNLDSFMKQMDENMYLMKSGHHVNQ